MYWNNKSTERCNSKKRNGTKTQKDVTARIEIDENVDVYNALGPKCINLMNY